MRKTVRKGLLTHESSPGDGRGVVLDAEDGARSRAKKDELDVVDDKLDDLKERSRSASERSRDKVSEEESRGGGELCREEGDGARGVLGDGRDGLDETRGEGDDQESVDDLEDEEAGHERELDAGLERDALKAREDCAR